VLICSPHPGEGKTYCAVNLALAIAAEKDSEVLLVDADFAKPSILSTLGLPGGRGLMDALADPTIRVEECVIATDIPGLFVLPAGNTTTSDS
jgi:Mrp family chromosome partitioning ATPase